MSNESNALAGPTVKVAWANQHLKVLNREIRKFLRNKPYAVSEKFDPARNRHEWRVARILREPKLERWGLLTGDCVHNLRSSLDHLAWNLAGQDMEDTTTQFPIFWEDRDWSGGRISRLPDEAQALIKTLQPNVRTDNGGKALALLAQLDNLEKHKTIPVVSAIAEETSITFEPLDAQSTTDPGAITYCFDAAVTKGSLLAYAEWRPEVKVKVKGKFEFAVTLGDGSPGAGYGLAWVLGEIATECERVIGLFARFDNHA